MVRFVVRVLVLERSGISVCLVSRAAAVLALELMRLDGMPLLRVCAVEG